MIITLRHAETITPQRAEKMLANNNVNRPLRESKVRDYAGRMERGEWRINGATITQDENGALIDGQHRLAAVVRSGLTIEAFIIAGLDPDIRPTVDGGLNRIFADDLAILGVTDSLHKASLLRKAVLWDHTHGLTTLGSETVTRSMLMEQWPKYETSVTEAAGPGRTYAAGTPVTSGAAAFIWWLLAKYGSDREVIGKFFSIIQDGSQDSTDSMLVRLRKFLDTPDYNPRTGRRKRITAKHEIYYLILAWNSWLTQEPVSYRLPHTGLSDPYPKPYTGKQYPMPEKPRGRG